MHKKIEYPPYEDGLSTDLLTSLALTGTNHAEDQPIHLRVDGGGPAGIGGSQSPSANQGAHREDIRRNHVKQNVNEFAGLLGHACPAAVYEYVEDEVCFCRLAQAAFWFNLKFPPIPGLTEL